MKALRRFITLMILLIALGAALYTQRVYIGEWVREATVPQLPEPVGYEKVEEVDKVEEGKEVVDVISSEPSAESRDLEDAVTEATTSINLAVPFTPQAPHADWSLPYKEACEEASLYMVIKYFESVPEGLVAADRADEDLRSIVDFERELFGYFEDTTVEQTGLLSESMFGYQFTLIENPTVDDIKAELVAGRPVIVPLAGRQLGNPYYTAPGPLYHMLVIRGFTEDGKFITNDPGTSRGEGYLYAFDTLMSAMHDWNAGGDIADGKKIALVVYP